MGRVRPHRLLTACLRSALRPSGSPVPLPSRPDWERLLADAESLGVTPLLHAALGSADPRVPPAIASSLRVAYYRQAALGGRLHDELGRILVALSARDIPVVLLKGAALAEPVYGNIALRPMQDLDLLVRSPDLAPADEVVRHLGYRADESYRPASWYRDRHHHLAPYGSADGYTALEIHRDILPPTAPLRVSIDDVWQRARPAVVAATPALVLAPHDLLLHLCLDVSCVDRFAGKLRSLCDIAATVQRYQREVDWPALLAQARGWRGERFVYYPLALARELLDADIPAAVLGELRSAARRSPLADIFLRTATRLAITRHARRANGLPGWILARMCGDLLAAEGDWQAVRSLRLLDVLGRATRRYAGRGQVA